MKFAVKPYQGGL